MFKFASSVLLRGGQGAADRYRCVWVALTVFQPHWVCPHSRVCVLSPSTLFRFLAAVYGVCPVLHAVPVFGYSTKVWTRLHLHFVPSPAQAAQAARTLMCALSLGVVHLLPSMVPALVSARASPVHVPCVYPQTSSWILTIQNLRKSLVRNWRPVCSVVGDAVSGAKFAPFPSPHLLLPAGMAQSSAG